MSKAINLQSLKPHTLIHHGGPLGAESGRSRYFLVKDVVAISQSYRHAFFIVTQAYRNSLECEIGSRERDRWNKLYERSREYSDQMREKFKEWVDDT